MTASHLLLQPIDREQAIDLLKDLYATGAIDEVELDRRTERVLTVPSRSHLDRVFAELGINRSALLRARIAEAAALKAEAEAIKADREQARKDGAGAFLFAAISMCFGPWWMLAKVPREDRRRRQLISDAANYGLVWLIIFSVMMGIVGEDAVDTSLLVDVALGVWLALCIVAAVLVWFGKRVAFPLKLRLFK